MSNKFIDISEHNTILSYNAIGQAGLKGCIMKATEGTTYVDHAVENNYEALKGKLPIGFYHYLTCTSSPVTQAQNFWNVIKDREYQIAPVLDVEQDKLFSNAEWYSRLFMEEFYKLSGQRMIIYSGRCYIEEHFSETFKSENIWWVADYSAMDTPKINNCNIIAWQYTEDCRSFSFTMGDLDCNILLNEENFYCGEVPYIEQTDEKNTAVGILQNELIVQGFTDMNGNELIIDGLAGELTLSACPTIGIGAQGNITKWIQTMIGINADGIFGEQTRQAVMQYQVNHLIAVDGIVGKNTWRKLLEL